MQLVAHIGNIPVEEWVPFVVPVVALYLYVRRKERRRRAAVERLPGPAQPLDEATVKRVIAAWSTKHREVSSEHLPLLYPPGPDGMSATELAERLQTNTASVERQLEDLAELDYVELSERPGLPGIRAWVTFRGYELLAETESALLASGRDSRAGEQARKGGGRG